MAKDDGFTKVYRDIRKNWIWEDKPFGRGQAFIDLLLMANYKDKKIMFNGDLIEVKRGSRITSLRKLSEQWGWSTNKTKKFLEQLQRDKMITYISDNKKTLVTIENYSSYQDRDNTEETDKEQSRDTEETQKKIKRNSEENQKKTNKKDKEYIKKDKEGEEGEEGEEKPPQLQPLSFPTPTHKSIFNIVGEVGYRTWFLDSIISEKSDLITIQVKEEFKKNIIQNKYVVKLNMLLKKSISVKAGD